MIQPLPNEVISDSEEIIATRTFHLGNLVLRLIVDHDMKLFRIQAYRVNDRTSHDLWGVWLIGDDEDRADIQLQATRKFTSIQL